MNTSQKQGTASTFTPSGTAQVCRIEVTSTGRGRGGGYYLSKPVTLPTEGLGEELGETKQAYSDEKRSNLAREERLYPIVRKWLDGEGYRSQISGATRSSGTWSNPDIIGMRHTEWIGRLDFEVACIEVKLSEDSWEKDFFQAVAYRRFANRSYFAYAVQESLSLKQPQHMRYYAETFGVGVLKIVLSDEDHIALKSGNELPDLGEYQRESCQELYSAPYNPVQISYQADFLQAKGVTGLEAIIRWGDADKGSVPIDKRR